MPEEAILARISSQCPGRSFCTFLKMLRGDAGGFTAIGVWVFAIADKAMRQGCHAWCEVGVKVEDTEQRHVGKAGQRSQLLQNFTFHILK